MMKQWRKSGRTDGEGVLGFPLEGFSLFQSLLLAFASAFLHVFRDDVRGIFALLAWNVMGGHSVSYADTYLYVGFPAGVLVLVVALPFFGVLWVRAKMREVAGRPLKLSAAFRSGRPKLSNLPRMGRYSPGGLGVFAVELGDLDFAGEPEF
jgi:hypothetical protein